MLQTRQATTADVETIHAITAAAYEPYIPQLGDRPSPMTTDYAPYVAAGEVWMVDRDGEAIAVAVLDVMPDHLVIMNLAVLPSAQGCGAGRRMLALAEERARHLGLRELRLFTHPKMTRNIGIYRTAGFVETGRRPNPKRAGWILVDMARHLD